MSLYEFNVARLNAAGQHFPLQTYVKITSGYAADDEIYVEGRKGSEYVLTFKNNSSHRVLIVPSVDGLSVMDGKPASIESSGYVVDRWSTVAIPGWRIDNGKVAKFIFQPQGDSRDLTYVEALKADGVAVDAANQGVIGCLVFPEKPAPVERPRGIFRAASGQSTMDSGMNTRRMGLDGNHAPFLTKGGPTLQNMSTKSVLEGAATMDWMGSDEDRSASSVGTGFGDDKDFRTTTIKFERADPKKPVATFVVMYDTIQGLRKRGVPIDANKNALANAFPASPELTRDGCRIPSRR